MLDVMMWSWTIDNHMQAPLEGAGGAKLFVEARDKDGICVVVTFGVK